MPTPISFARVHWEWKLLTNTMGGGSSHRVARRTGSIIQPAGVLSSSFDRTTGYDAQNDYYTWRPQSGTSLPPKPPLPPLTDGSGHNFEFAFWKYYGGTNKASGLRVPAPLIYDYPDFGSDAPVGSNDDASATAYFTWDFGNGGGANGVYIDAFDQYDFFAEDFVTVAPGGASSSDPLYVRANDGELITDPPSADITQPVTITAANTVGTRVFKQWHVVQKLAYQINGSPDITGPNIVNVVPGCRYVAYAEYFDEKTFYVPPTIPNNFDWKWFIETMGGLVAPGTNGPVVGPVDPLRQELLASLFLSRAAGIVSPKLRVGVLKSLVELLSGSARNVEQEIERLRAAGNQK